MGFPVQKGIRDYKNTYDYSFTTITVSNTTETKETTCTDYFTHQFGTGESTYTCSSVGTTTTTPTTSVIPTFNTSNTKTNTSNTSLLTGTSIITSPPSTATEKGSFTFSRETWRSLSYSTGGVIADRVAWLPIGVGGLAKWFMADKGDPSFGVKKRIHELSDDVAEHKGRLEKNGVLETGIKGEVYDQFFKNGKFLNSTMCNERYVGQGMEGFISGSFIFRYNLQNPDNKIFAQIEDKIWQQVDAVFYPTTWLRVKIRGVQLNNNGEIVAISLLTKYGTGDTPTFGARENFHTEGSWNDTPTLLSEDSSTVGYEGHTAIVDLSNLWDHSDKKIFHFFANPEKNPSGESAFISSLSINVPNSFSYPLSVVDGEVVSGTSGQDRNKVKELQEGAENFGLTPIDPLVDLEASKVKVKKYLNTKLDISWTNVDNNPKEDDTPISQPSDNKVYALNDLIPSLFRISTDAGADTQYSSTTFPYKKTFKIGGVEVAPKIAITEYLEIFFSDTNPDLYTDLYSPSSQIKYIHKLVNGEKKHFIANVRWVWDLDLFGETDNTIDVKYAGFNHDVISSETMTKQRLDYDISTGWRWQDGSSLFQGEIFPIKIKGVASNLSGYSLQVSGIAETIKKDFYWGNRLHDEATIINTSDANPLDGTGQTKVYILNFLTS